MGITRTISLQEAMQEHMREKCYWRGLSHGLLIGIAAVGVVVVVTAILG